MLGAMSGLLAALLVAIEIRAAGDCPAAAAVSRRLAPLMEAGAEAGSSDVATIAQGADGSLVVSLQDAAGRSVGDRRFPRGGSCGDRADTVAVTLAIWQAQLHPEIALRLDRLAPEAPPAAPPPAPVIVTRAPPPPPASTLSVGAAVAGAWQSASWAPAARLELGLGRAESRWRARLAALGIGRHTQAVGAGQARWWRAGLSLGGDVDLARGRTWAVGLGAGAIGGVVSVSGAGFTTNRTSRSLDGGGELRARFELRPGRIRPWVGVSVVGWLRRQGLDLDGVPTSALPRVEPAVAAGADFLW
jgi:hypothetical protein